MSDDVILCVDDEAIILLSLKHELKAHYRSLYRFETATDAADALDLLERLRSEGTRVALIISDWLMPGMKGDEFLVEVRRRHPDIQSIMVTGHADPASMERVLKETNTRTILRKPWRSEELIHAIDSCIHPPDTA